MQCVCVCVCVCVCRGCVCVQGVCVYEGECVQQVRLSVEQSSSQTTTHKLIQRSPWKRIPRAAPTITVSILTYTVVLHDNHSHQT